MTLLEAYQTYYLIAYEKENRTHFLRLKERDRGL